MFPTITTRRCLLRKIVPSDQTSIFEGLSNPEVIKYYGVSFSSYDNTREQMDWYNNLLLSRSGIWWAICSRKDKTFMGACGFNNWNQVHRKAEIGFWILPDFRRKGITEEAVKAILKYGKQQLNLHRIEAQTEPENNASNNLLLKLGFEHEGTLKHSEIKDGKFIDLSVFAFINK